MFDGLVTDYIAQVETNYRQTAVYPKAERKARHLRELRLAQTAEPRAPRRPAPARWLGEQLLRVGRRLRGADAPASA